MQVAEEAGRAGRGGELIQKFRILQVFLVFSLIEILYIGPASAAKRKIAESGLFVRRRVCRLTVHTLASPTQTPRNVCLHRRLHMRHEYSHALSSATRVNGGCGGRASRWCVGQPASGYMGHHSAQLVTRKHDGSARSTERTQPLPSEYAAHTLASQAGCTR